MVEELYREHAAKLRVYCAGICGDGGVVSADDLMQEVFMRALMHIDDLERLNTAQRRAWLYKAARNLFIDFVRRNSLAESRVQEFEDMSCELGFSRTEVLMLLDCLPHELRTIFCGRYFDGYNASELAEMYGLSPSTVRVKLMQARRILRKNMCDE